MATAQNYIGGGHSTEKMYTGRGDTAHIFLIKGTIRMEKKHILGGGDTAHTLLGWGHRTTIRVEKKHILGGGDTAYTFLIWGKIGVEKTYYCRGGHRTHFVDGGSFGVGTPHNIERTS